MNTIILKILEYANSGDLYNVLFDLLYKSKTENVPSKYLGLAVKCIQRHTKALEKIKDNIEPEKILFKMHCYQATNGTDKNADDIGNKTIKTVLNELVKVLGEEKIEECYQVVESDQRPDHFLKRWIHVIVQQRYLPNNSTHQYGGSAQRGTHNMSQQQQHQQQNDADNSFQTLRERQKVAHEANEIRTIVDKYSRNDVHQQYVNITRELYGAIMRNPNINVENYLGETGNLRDKIINDLQKQHEHARSKERQAQNQGQNYSNTMPVGGGDNYNNMMNNSFPSGQKTTPHDINEIQSKLNEMKSSNRNRTGKFIMD